MIWRAYFNKRGERPWSIDRGGPDSEMKVDDILIVEGMARFHYTGMPPSEEIPIAWVEVEAHTLTITPLPDGKKRAEFYGD